MKKAFKWILIVLAAIVILPVLLYGIFRLAVPISRSDEGVRAYVLHQIPMGTGWDDAISVAEDKEWQIRETRTDRGLHINEEAGMARFASEEEMRNGPENEENVRIVGEQAMFVHLGEYSELFCVDVLAYLAFDENGELVEVAIKRYVDAL